MQARKVKALRRRQAAERKQRQWEAARALDDECGSLLLSLPVDYSCLMTCTEVEAAADFLRAFGTSEEYIEELIDEHRVDDEPGEMHHVCDDECRTYCAEVDK